MHMALDTLDQILLVGPLVTGSQILFVLQFEIPQADASLHLAPFQVANHQKILGVGDELTLGRALLQDFKHQLAKANIFHIGRGMGSFLERCHSCDSTPQ
jgi:hypothetical protein